MKAHSKRTCHWVCTQSNWTLDRLLSFPKIYEVCSTTFNLIYQCSHNKRKRRVLLTECLDKTSLLVWCRLHKTSSSKERHEDSALSNDDSPTFLMSWTLWRTTRPMHHYTSHFPNNQKTWCQFNKLSVLDYSDQLNQKQMSFRPPFETV